MCFVVGGWVCGERVPLTAFGGAPLCGGEPRRGAWRKFFSATGSLGLADCAGAFCFGWLGRKSTVKLLKNSLMLFGGKVQLGFASRQGGRKGARLVYYSCFHGDTHRVPRVWARRPSAGRGEGREVQRGVDGGTGAGSPHDPSLALAERAAMATPHKRCVNWLALC